MVVADETADPARAPPTCSRRPSTAPTARRARDDERRARRARSRARRGGASRIEVGRLARGGARARRTSTHPSTSSCSSPTRRPLAARVRTPARSSSGRGTGRGRRLRRRREPRPADRRAGARRGRARAGGVPQAGADRAARRREGLDARARDDRRRSRAARGPAAARAAVEARFADGRDEALARPRAGGLRALRLGAHGRGGRRARTACRRPRCSASTRTCRRCPVCRRCRSARASRALNEYPEGTYRELREAAAAYAGVEPGRRSSSARARDDLIGLVARTFLGAGPPRRGATPDLSAVRDRERHRGRRGRRAPLEPSVAAPTSSGSATRTTRPASCAEPEAIAALARALPDARRRRRRGVLRVRRPDRRAVVRERPTRRASGRSRRRSASPRSGSATRSPRPRSPRSSTAPRAGARSRRRRPGSRPPRCATRGSTSSRTIAERERMRDALLAAGFDVPAARRRTSSTCRSTTRPTLADRLEAQGLVVRRFPARSGSRRGSPPRTTGCSRRSGPVPAPPPAALGAGRADDGRDGAPRLARSRRPRPAASRPASASSTTCWRSSRSTAGSTSR